MFGTCARERSMQARDVASNLQITGKIPFGPRKLKNKKNSSTKRKPKERKLGTKHGQKFILREKFSHEGFSHVGFSHVGFIKEM